MVLQAILSSTAKQIPQGFVSALVIAITMSGIHGRATIDVQETAVSVITMSGTQGRPTVDIQATAISVITMSGTYSRPTVDVQETALLDEGIPNSSPIFTQ